MGSTPVVRGIRARRLLLVGAIVAGGGALLASSPALAQGETESEPFQVVRTIETGSKPGPVIYAYGRAWVLSQGDNRVWMINPTTGAVRGLKVAANSQDLVAGFNRIWALGGNRRVAAVHQLSRRGNLQRRIKHRFRAVGDGGLPEPANTIKAGAGRIWVGGANSSDRLLEIRPGSRRAVERRWATPAAFTVEKGSLWTLSENGNFLFRRNARNLRITKRINVSRAVGDMTGSAWISYAKGLFYISYVEPNDVGQINAVSPSRGVLSARGYQSDIALNCTDATSTAIWVAKAQDPGGFSPQASVTKLAPRTLSVLQTQSPFPTGSTNGNVSCVAAGGGYVGVTDGVGTTYQLGPKP